jgi:HEAT repeat protein
VTGGRLLVGAGAAAAVALLAAAALAVDPTVLRQARSTKSGDRWTACEPLAKDGSPEAVKLLLNILRLDDDHENRDHAAWACWHVPNDEAVEPLAAMGGGAAPPAMRCRAAYALARTHRARALEPLLRMARTDGAVSVRREAVEGLRWFGGESAALDACRAAAKSSDVVLRACAVDAAGAMAKDAGRDIVLAAWSDSDEGVRCAALAAMGADDAVARLPAAAASKDWRLRAQAVATGLRWRRAAGIDPMIGLVADESRRVASAALRALRFLSGKEIAPDPELWHAWWDASRATWSAPKGTPNDAAEKPLDPKTTRASFHGVEIESDRMVFVLDHSTSMEKAMPSGGRRIDAMRSELTRTLGALPDDVRVNLVVFGESVRAFATSARPLTAKTRQAIVAFSAATPLESETNLAGGVLEALDDDGVDTIYLLTDGGPSVGDFVSFTRVRMGLDRANRTRRVALHAIGFGVTHANTRGFLKDLADDHDGRFVSR